MRVAVAELTEAVAGKLTRAGASARSASVTAEAVVYAEASGIVSHGLVRVRPLAEQLRSGKINGAALFTPVAKGEVLRLIDAEHGLGYAAAAAATEAVIEALESSPMAVAAVSRSHHFGVAGRYTERLAAAGHVGMALSSTFGAIAPIGGAAALLGNPPVSVAVPRRGDDPVVVDLAPAVTARGRIAAAAEHGEPIPLGWARDEHGEATTDAAAAMRGTLEAIGGDKGVVLAMLADVLVAALTVSDLPGEASSVFTPDGPPPRLGHVIIGFDPKAFGVDAESRTEAYVAALGAGRTRMRVPGGRRRERRAQAAEHGVEVAAGNWTYLTGE
ncbi:MULTISPECIES: Ldh family oxidoreductase [Streptomyces]|uniref:Ldh family oxidoreductase n=1 Tax=Streptomyces edwardsiae TaxID=3075527 RepID=A0ABU2QCY8_9ACTN|nr:MULTISPECIES: Ldh family oxidoreductase [unclassified Streptomyces]MDT0401793.1 Ldh family oxidoreductase [Streptomyces sp. DSM 41635]